MQFCDACLRDLAQSFVPGANSLTIKPHTFYLVEDVNGNPIYTSDSDAVRSLGLINPEELIFDRKYLYYGDLIISNAAGAAGNLWLYQGFDGFLMDHRVLVQGSIPWRLENVLFSDIRQIPFNTSTSFHVNFIGKKLRFEGC